MTSSPSPSDPGAPVADDATTSTTGADAPDATAAAGGPDTDRSAVEASGAGTSTTGATAAGPSAATSTGETPTGDTPAHDGPAHDTSAAAPVVDGEDAGASPRSGRTPRVAVPTAPPAAGTPAAPVVSGSAAPEAPGEGATPTEGSRVTRLEEEGEVAADYLEELLDIVDLDGDIDIDVADARAVVSVVGEDDGGAAALRLLAGPHGEVLEALQELTRLAVQTRTGERSRLMLDVAGYRAERREQLLVIAGEALRRVQDEGEPVALDPMNPFERKVVHDAVAAAGLVSDSDGVEPQRRVVIHPRQG